jgi:uncharacterized membrane protein
MAVLFSADNCLVGCVGGSLQNCVCWCRRIYQPDILHARSSAAHHVGAVVCAFISGHSTKAGHRLGSGNIAFFHALVIGGKVSIVVPATALFPIVTVILATTVLRERLGKLQILGFVLALIAIYLLSI